MFRTLLVFLLGAAVAIGAEYALRHREGPTEDRGTPVVSANLPDDPGDPPIVWLEGLIEGLDAAEMTLREGEGPTITIRRFEEGATDFLRLTGGRWRQLRTTEIDGLPPDQQACVETLLDGRTFFALRVFVGARCGPA
jgi:hypothetical protein